MQRAGLVGVVAFLVIALLVPASATLAQTDTSAVTEQTEEEAGDAQPSRAGDLVGNWSGALWLLIPLAIVLAAATAFALGPDSAGADAGRRQGGVSRAMARRAAEGGHPTS